MLVDPHIYLAGVEAQEVTPLEVGDAVFEDKSANVADIDAELVSDCGDVDEPVAVLVSAVVGGGHGLLLPRWGVGRCSG